MIPCAGTEWTFCGTTWVIVANTILQGLKSLNGCCNNTVPVTGDRMSEFGVDYKNECINCYSITYRQNQCNSLNLSNTVIRLSETFPQVQQQPDQTSVDAD